MRFWIDRDGIGYLESESDYSDSMNEVYVQRPTPNGACYRWDWALWEWVVDPAFAKNEVRARGAAGRSAVLLFKGHPFKLDTAGLVELHSAVIESQKEGAVVWPTFDNDGNYIELSPADVIDLHAGIHRYNRACFSNERALLKAIDDGASPLDVVSTGWPDPILVPVEETPEETEPAPSTPESETPAE